MGTYCQEVNQDSGKSIYYKGIHLSSFGRKDTLCVEEGINC